jgi:hypothetical protein
MVHYLNGVPANADLNRDGNIVHSHKNCLEWLVFDSLFLVMPSLFVFVTTRTSSCLHTLFDKKKNPLVNKFHGNIKPQLAY